MAAKQNAQGGAKSFLERLYRAFNEQNLDSRCLDKLKLANRDSNQADDVVRMDGFYNYKFLTAFYHKKNKQIQNNVQRVSGVVFQSVIAKLFYEMKFGKLLKPHLVIPNGIFPAPFCKRDGQQHVIMMVNATVNHRPLHYLFIARIYKRNFTNVKFSLFWGNKRNLERLLMPYWLISIINFCMGQPVELHYGRSLNEIKIQLCDDKVVAVYLSNFAGDSCPNSVIELQNLSIPVISSGGGGAAELVPRALKLDEQTVFDPSPFFFIDIIGFDSNRYSQKISDVFEQYSDFSLEAHRFVTQNNNIYDISQKYFTFLTTKN